MTSVLVLISPGSVLVPLDELYEMAYDQLNQHTESFKDAKECHHFDEGFRSNTSFAYLFHSFFPDDVSFLAHPFASGHSCMACQGMGRNEAIGAADPCMMCQGTGVSPKEAPPKGLAPLSCIDSSFMPDFVLLPEGRLLDESEDILAALDFFRGFYGVFIIARG